MSCNSDEKNIARQCEEESEPVLDDTDEQDVEHSYMTRSNTPESSHVHTDEFIEISSTTTSPSNEFSASTQPVFSSIDGRHNSERPDATTNPSLTGEVVASDDSSITNVTADDLVTTATTPMDYDQDATTTMERWDNDDVESLQVTSRTRSRPLHRHDGRTTTNNNAWRQKLKAMVLQARDGSLIIFQRVMEPDNNSTSNAKDLDEDDFEQGTTTNVVRSTTRMEQNTELDSTQHQSLRHYFGTSSEFAPPNNEDVNVQSDAVPSAPDTDAVSVNSSTSFGSWSVSWPRPGAYFVRYMRRHPGDHPLSPISTRQHRDFNMASAHSRSIATLISADVNFPYAIPILDDDDSNIVRVHGIQYDHDAAARMIKRRRRRCMGMIALFSAILLAFAAVGVVVVVLARKTHFLAPTITPPPFRTKSHSPSASPTPYHVYVTINSYLDRFAQAVGNDLVYRNGTAHRLAANWIFYSDPLQLPVYNEHLIQRYLMALFYFQMSDNGKSPWRFCNPPPKGVVDSCMSLAHIIPLVANDDSTGYQYYRWLSGKHECNWMGASCDADNVIWDLQLNGMNLTGTLPTEITLMTSLQSLSLSDNFINGTISSAFPRLENLVLFNLQGNSLTGTLSEAWYQAKLLRSLDVGRNRLTGNISSMVGRLGNLTGLQLHDNEMTGTVPTDIGKLRRLTTLTLGANFFHGTIPSELGQLDMLQQLSLNKNKLVGNLPSELGLLTAMTELRLGHNAIGGTIPESFYNLTNLQLIFELQNMNLNGTISTKIGLMTNLRSLLLSKNHFQGTVPSQISNLKYLGIASFGLNLFTGAIPAQLCQRPLELQADCASTDSTFQECSCCASCCDRTYQNCTFNKLFSS